MIIIFFILKIQSWNEIVSLSDNWLSLYLDSVGNSNTTIEEDSEGSSDDLENPFASFVNPDISISLLSEDEDWNLRNI